MNPGIAGGVGQFMTGLASAIAQRRQRTYETDQQERSAKAFNEYLRTGQVSPDMLNLAPGMINALTPQTPQPSGSITPGNYVPDPNSPGGYKQVGEPKTTEKPPKTFGEMTDNELAYLAGKDPEAKALLDERVNRQIKVFGTKEGIKADNRPDKTQNVPIDMGDGNVKYGSIQTDPNTGEVKVVMTNATPPRSAATQRITSGDRQYLTEAEGLTKVINDIEKNFDEGFVGPIAGRIGEAKSVTVGNSPKEASFRAAVSSLKNQLLKLRSGAAVTDQEFERILSELPTENDPTENFKQKLRQTKENVDLLKTTRTNLQGGATTGKMTREQFIKDFQKEEGRDPSEQELEQLRQMGEWQ
jgi:hypothetical protein